MDVVDHDTLLAWLTRLQLTAIRDQLDSLLDEAAEKKLTLREALSFLVEREVSRKDERRIEMAFKIAHFPAVRELADFDFEAQPSVDERQVRELATSRWVAHGDAALQPKRDGGSPGEPRQRTALGLDLTGGWKPSWEVIDSEVEDCRNATRVAFPGSCRRAPSCASSAGGCSQSVREVIAPTPGEPRADARPAPAVRGPIRFACRRSIARTSVSARRMRPVFRPFPRSPARWSR